jgi:hypothetical protein
MAAHAPESTRKKIRITNEGAKMLTADKIPKPDIPVRNTVLRLVMSEILPIGRLMAATAIV